MATAQIPTLTAHHSWVAGREAPGRGGTRPAIAPATGEPFAEVSLLDAAQAGEAVAAAAAAFPSWSRTSFRARGAAAGPPARARGARGRRDRRARSSASRASRPPRPTRSRSCPRSRRSGTSRPTPRTLLRDDAVEAQQLLLAHKEARLVYSPIGRRAGDQALELPLGPEPARGRDRTDGRATRWCSSPRRRPPWSACGIGALAREAGFPDGALSVVAIGRRGRRRRWSRTRASARSCSPAASPPASG